MTVTEVKAEEGSFEDFKAHCKRPRTHTELLLFQVLKERHIDYHVIEVDTDDFDLKGYAEAGFANCEIEEDDHTLTSSVAYIASPSRSEQDTKPGQLRYSSWWTKYQYTWNEASFVLYSARVPTNCGYATYLFVLTKREPDTPPRGVTATTKKLLLSVGEWTRELHEEIYVFDSAYWSKSKQLWKDIQSSTWNDVILDPTMKEGLIEDVEGFFDSRGLYQEFQVPWKRGIIFHGLPGNGKTISIKALMARLQRRPDDPVPSLYVKSFEDRNAGQQYAIRSIFRKARKMAPCLLIFEDLDSLITNETRSYFLNEVDGLESNDGILMIGSTNHLDQLDPAIRDRPSRFDRKYHYQLPSQSERASYAKYWQKKLEKNPRTEFPDDACDVIAAMTDGFSFAYLKELFVATLLAIARGAKGKEPIPASLLEDDVKDQSTPESVSENVPPKGEDVQEEPKEVAEDDGKPTIALRRQAVINVKVPEHLKDCVLVNVIRHQVLILLKDMSNGERPRIRVETEGSAKAIPRQLKRRMARYMEH
ncbi:hypothetical protein JX266_011749 [Neoarthrinium moseri]|nr:hypothetical protein JX266_011749 [Neoarthrinium moseri]